MRAGDVRVLVAVPHGDGGLDVGQPEAPWSAFQHLVAGVAAESLPYCFADRCEIHGPDPWILEELFIGCWPRQGQEPVGFVDQPVRGGGYCGGRLLRVAPRELDQAPAAVVEVGPGGRDLVDWHDAAHERDPGDTVG